MDSRGPRLRLSIVGYLTDNGVTPETVGGSEEWLDLIDKTVTWIGENMEEYADTVANLEIPEETDSADDFGVRNAYDDLREGHKGDGYL